MLRDLLPEVEMVVRSKCHNPLKSFLPKGTFGPLRLWPEDPQYFNINYEHTLEGNGKPQLVATGNTQSLHSRRKEQPVIFVGTHHKTGTYLSNKIFAKICSTMDWCCVFQRTSESIYSMYHSLDVDSVNVMGHSHWLWSPRQMDVASYKFIHFFRDPYAKITSGYRYHKDGIEMWSRMFTDYDVCSAGDEMKSKYLLSNFLTGHGTNNNSISSAVTPGQVSSSPSPAAATATAKERLNNKLTDVPQEDVVNYCAKIHLCETCCRYAHQSRPVASEMEPRFFKVRRAEEYDFICKHLGRSKGSSIQDTYKALPVEQGILTEAALEYYEVLRMAQLVNETLHDQHSLNIELDYMSKYYDRTIELILDHLKDLIPPKTRKQLQKDLQFYNLDTSPIYRWSMSDHTTSQGNSKNEAKKQAAKLRSSGGATAKTAGLNSSSSSSSSSGSPVLNEPPLSMESVLQRDPEVQRLYAPAYKMLSQAFTRNKLLFESAVTAAADNNPAAAKAKKKQTRK